MIVLLTKTFVAGNAVVWMAFGPTFYFATETFANYLDISLRSPTALADFRGVYGGLHLAAGVFMLKIMVSGVARAASEEVMGETASFLLGVALQGDPITHTGRGDLGIRASWVVF